MEEDQGRTLESKTYAEERKNKMESVNEHDWEHFRCTSCGFEVWRLSGTYDMPVCVECRWWDERDPSGKLRQERAAKLGK